VLGIFNSLRKKVVDAVSEGDTDVSDEKKVDNLISLGVLLWAVAEADDKFLPEEEESIAEILKTYGHIRKEDMSIVLRAIEEASLERVDFYKFTSEVSKDLEYDAKVEIIEDLFRVACSDKDLDNEEYEMIRKISGLLKVEHKEFIDAKMRVKKEFGINNSEL